ncbi:MAG: nucleoside-diphosphate kinase [Candidatus Campbellbacteria bacterium]|nr:nucleoside-diphosphate kinase [Candidatus Campbellbacteria bacterium]
MDHPKKEQTFVMVKPDGVQRSLVGEIVSRIERTGLKLVGLKMLVPGRSQAAEHYGKDEAWCEKVGNRIIENIKDSGEKPGKSALEYGQEVLEGLYDFLTAGPVVQMVFEGNQAVGVVKKIVGDTEPLSSDVGTIRGDLTVDSYEIANVDGRAVRNLIHCSDEREEAKREIQVWFSKDELVRYRHINERMLYDVNIDGILE